MPNADDSERHFRQANNCTKLQEQHISPCIEFPSRKTPMLRPTTGVSETTQSVAAVYGVTPAFFFSFSPGHPIKKQQQLPRFESSASKLKKKLKKTCLTITFSLGQISSKKKWEGDMFSAPQVGPRPIHLQGPRTNVNLQNQTMKHESPSAGGFLSLIKFPMFRVVCFNPWYLNTRFLLEKKVTLLDYPSVG